MGLDDRIWYFIIGAFAGFVLGYITRALRDIKKELHEVDKIVKDERGFVRYSLVANVSLVLVLALSLYASFATQRTNNELKKTQGHIEKITECNQEYLAKTVSALNGRTTYTTSQATANIRLIRAQAEFLATILVEPPPDPSVSRQALRLYFDPAVIEFVESNSRALRQYRENPYPTEQEIQECLYGN